MRMRRSIEDGTEELAQVSKVFVGCWSIVGRLGINGRDWCVFVVSDPVSDDGGWGRVTGDRDDVVELRWYSEGGLGYGSGGD
ncbi:hypothetical protein M6B38_387805 [Iris pallida]|uniref:Uncharacterized protein n=1 Tax=Iris pallida TaxID=29817 RepID=A0AAX6E4T1_IRIPA|nr:hypothetical protein M6B38_211340 [Iris pallida]KAJ6822748.1 hypothetical protein M6B38_387805 [Iris pallida]